MTTRTFLDIDTIAEISQNLKKTNSWYSIGLCHHHNSGGKTYFKISMQADDFKKLFGVAPTDQTSFKLGSLVHVQGPAVLNAWTGEDGSLQTGLVVYPKSISGVSAPTEDATNV